MSEVLKLTSEKPNRDKWARPYLTPQCVFVGEKFHRLTVLAYSHTDKNSKRHFRCLCDCGNYVSPVSSALKSGNTKSCGCLQSECGRALMKKMRNADVQANWERNEKILNLRHSGFSTFEIEEISGLGRRAVSELLRKTGCGFKSGGWIRRKKNGKIERNSNYVD